MAMTGRFDANFETFYAAVEKAVVELKGFDAATGQVESSMNRMVDTFSGRKILTEATIMVEAIEKIGGVSKLTADELQRVGTVAAEAAEKQRAWGGEVPANIQKYADAAKEASTATSEWGTAMSSFAAVAGAFGIQSLVSTFMSLTREIMASADELDKLRSRTGIGAETLQHFQAAGDAAGNTLEQISSAALKLAENVHGGNKSTVAALEALGIKVEEFRRLPIEEQFLAIAKAIKEIPDPTNQVTTALDLMGQKGVTVLPTLKSDLEAVSKATKAMSDDTVTYWATASNNLKRNAADMKVTVADWFEYLYGGWTRNERAAKAFGDEMKNLVATVPTPGPFVGLVPPTLPEDLKEVTTDLEATHKGLVSNRLETEGWNKIFDEMHKTTFALAMEHEKQWRDESAKLLAARNTEVVNGLNQTRSAFGAYFDFLDKETLDSTDYQIKKIWEKVDADKLAFKGSEEQAKAYYAAVDALADAQTTAIMTKAAAAEASKAAATDRAAAREVATIQRTGNETQAELDKMSAAANAAFDQILAKAGATQEAIEAAQRAASDAAYYAQLNPNGIDSSKKWMPQGGTLFPGGGGYPDTIEGRLASLNAEQARYPTIPINTAYLFQGVPMTQSSPMYSGGVSAGGGSFNQTINVTQPLGTPTQIARAVGDAQISTLQGQGVRLPYGQ